MAAKIQLLSKEIAVKDQQSVNSTSTTTKKSIGDIQRINH